MSFDGHTHLDILEALLLASDRPLTSERIAGVIPRVKPDQVGNLVEHLNSTYEEGGRTFRVRSVAGGYRLYTLPEYQGYIEALAVTVREARLSQAALETLAVVAYRQPVSRSDIEYVRGCDCDGVIRTLLARRLISIKGRSDAPGRPLLYATTERFLEYFGLASLNDLPDWSEIAALVGEPTRGERLTLVRGGEIGRAEAKAEPGTQEASGVNNAEVPGDTNEPDTVDSDEDQSPFDETPELVTVPQGDAS